MHDGEFINFDLAVELNSQSSSGKVMEWVYDCNEKLIQREFGNIEEALKFIFDKYQAKLKKSTTKKYDQENDGEEDEEPTYNDNDNEDVDMNEEEGEDLGEWDQQF